ncbi:MAG: hypothetical protein Q9P44_05455 [Anaerolineae bacterium]|nr:hypothetical protein [Anaerolineae bacterium]
MRFFYFFFALLILILPVVAQDAEPIIETTAYRQVLVYAGPGITFPEVSLLNPGIPATIIERNTIGNWLHVQRYDNGNVVMDGWVISGYLNLPPELQYGDIPINDLLSDADSSTISSESMSELLTMPIIPTISDAMLDVFERGQTLGNQANMITKVGDSLSAAEQYMSIFSADESILGPYNYLEETLNFYADSTRQNSVASQIGMTSYAVFDPFWADSELCESGESPLTCEFRLHQPSIAFIIFCGNDVRHMTDTDYDGQMRMLVEQSLESGVIPVLFTCSTHPDEAFFWQSINFNLRIKTIAEDYEIPAINLWSAARHLPQFGLDEDLIHLRHSGFDFLKYDSGQEAYSGISLQNLLVLRTLDEIRLSLNLE